MQWNRELPDLDTAVGGVCVGDLGTTGYSSTFNSNSQ